MPADEGIRRLKQLAASVLALGTTIGFLAGLVVGRGFSGPTFLFTIIAFAYAVVASAILWAAAWVLEGFFRN